jgi:hypothetical protein
MSTSHFSIDIFERLAGGDLHAYMEPLLARVDLNVADTDIRALDAAIVGRDEYHLVYSLVLLARFAPAKVLKHLPVYLASHLDSVFCAALNILEDLPDDLRKLVLPDLLSASTVNLRPELKPFIEKYSTRMRTKR